MTFARLAAALAAVGLLSGSAVAQTPGIPDVKGTWTGSGEAIVDGETPHHPANDAKSRQAAPYRLSTISITMKIEGQDGRRFWGTFTSDRQTNRLIGSLSADGKWLYMAGGRGLIDATLLDADTMEQCYRHASEKSAAVICEVIKRQK
jgi:hypothetical protein